VVATAASGTAPNNVTAATPASHDFDGPASAVELTVTAGFRGAADPGSWGLNIGIGITANADGTFNLAVQYLGALVETWSNLKIGGTGQQDPQQINDEVTGSKFIIVSIPSNATVNPSPTVDASNKATFQLLDTGGADDNLDGSALVGAKDAQLKLPIDNRIFDPIAIQLLCCPESSGTATGDALVTAALTYCADRGDCMFVGHTPFGFDGPSSRDYGIKFRADKVYGALYFPWIRVADPLGTFKWIPPTGHVLGVYARTDQERGVWKAPAGNAAHVNNALDVQFSINDVVHTDMVKNGSVNAVRFISGQGIVVDSSRTLSTNTLWLYVNVRLLFNFVKSSLKSGLRWVVQEPNGPQLWNKVKFSTVVPFLMGLWRRGAFGPGAPDQVFSVKIDQENNPGTNIQQGILTLDVFFFPSRPAETIIITVGQQDGGATATEG
jgi:phage tail sheath protein FI